MRIRQALPVLLLSTTAYADITLTAVPNYSLAAVQDLWRGVGNDEVPARMVGPVTAPSPRSPYGRLFPRAFMQSPDLLVCFQSCVGDTDRIRGSRDGQGAVTGRGNAKDALEQQNIYHWLTRYYAFMRERLNLAPTGRITALASPRLSAGGPIMRNNAHYLPTDNSLSFYPATSNPLAVLFQGRINRSGFDPSVIAHEAGHSLFRTLFPEPINAEIGGLNEGFADYLANVFLGDSRVGMIMLRGQSLRDSSKVKDREDKYKSYAPRLEMHDLGERIATALWRSRESVQDKPAFDRLVVQAVRDISGDRYSTMHGYKAAFLAQVDANLDPVEAARVRVFFESHLAGEDRRIRDTSFLSGPPADVNRPKFEIRLKVTLPAALARAMGAAGVMDTKLTLLKEMEIGDGITATLASRSGTTAVPAHWIAVDNERGTLRGLWDASGQVATGRAMAAAVSVAEPVANLKGIMATSSQQLTRLIALSSGNGPLASSHRVRNRQSSTATTDFNGAVVPTKILSMSLDRNLRGALAGAEELSRASLITIPAIPDIPATWPRLNGEPVVAYLVELKDGTVIETILSHWH